MFLPSILAFLAPIAIYCWVLAVINRRSQPTVVSGLWDCVGMLLAAGGILLMVGPFLLHRLFWRIMDALPPEEDTETGFDLVMRQWWFFWALYFMVLLLAVFLLLWWRRSKTVIYNVDPEMFGHVLHDCLEELGLTSTRDGKRLLIAAKSPDRKQTEAVFAGAGPSKRSANLLPSFPPHAAAELEVEVFPSLYNVSLHWPRAEGQLRAAIENHLARALEGARAFDNPAANWFMGMAGLLFGLICLTGMIWLLTIYFPRR
ncbi:MAG TPA: hypothetical protein VNX28_16940 [Gemmataceae bacterium]|nr:hypothetical protein [Gemmataceae bacterium]